MTPDRLIVLRETYRREGLGLLQYVRQTAPYATRTDRPIVERIMGMAAEEGRILEKMADELLAGRTDAPRLGGFPTTFTNFNYFAVRKLLPLLVQDAERLIAALRRAAGGGEPSLEQELMSVKLKHLTEMNAFTESVTTATAG